MMRLIPADTATAALRRIRFTLVDATDLVTPEDIDVTGVKVTLSVDGATPADSSNDIVKVSGATGEYYIELTQAESDQAVGAIIAGWLQPSGCALTKVAAQIATPQSADVADVKAKTDALTFDVAGAPNVNITHGNGTDLYPTLQAGTTSGTLVLDASEPDVDGYYEGVIFEVPSIGSRSYCTAYVGSTRTATVAELNPGAGVPAAGQRYWPTDLVNVALVGGRPTVSRTQPGGDGTTTLVLALTEPPGTEAWVGKKILFEASGEIGTVSSYDGDAVAGPTVTFSPPLNQALSATGNLVYSEYGDSAASGGSAPTADEIADAVLDEAMSGHNAAGTLGHFLQTTIATHLNEIKGTTFDTMTDSLEAIRNRGDSSWTTATGFSTFDPSSELVRLAPDQSSVTIGVVHSLTGHTPQTGDTFALANGSTGFAAIKGDTSAIPPFPANFSSLAIDVNGLVTTGTVLDKRGYALAGDGLDPISVEAGVNARQALSPILAAVAGTLSGAGTGSVAIQGGNSTTTRITATTDNAGNRTAVVLTLPS